MVARITTLSPNQEIGYPRLLPTMKITANLRQTKQVRESEAHSNSANNGYVKISTKTKQSKAASVTGLAIVPVRVKAKGSLETVESYAFLDSGSNTSFCTEGLLEGLKGQRRKTKLSLTTMHGEATPIECSIVELQISNLDGQNQVKIPQVYSTPSLLIRKKMWHVGRGTLAVARWRISMELRSRISMLI